MAQYAYFLLKSIRPRQWVKNLAVYAALVFSGFLFYPGYFVTVTIAYMVFCGLTSAVYLINDVVDSEQDKKHPFKKKRPIASGDLPVPIALFAAIGLLFSALAVGWSLSFYFFLILVTYLLVNFAYTGKLKRVPILELLVIAAGFVLRVYAGASVVNLHLNVWFLLTVISLALFLAIGKRQSERTLLSGMSGGLAGHRSTLSAYSPRLMDIYTGMFASATWLTYSLFAFQHQFEFADGPIPTIFSAIPKTLVTRKWLMITVPLVIYGVMRYLHLVYEKNEGESPERVLLSDKPLLLIVIIWGLVTVGVLYGIG